MLNELQLKEVLEVLRSGGTILYPTDTIWGIGCDATNPRAVEKVYRIKERLSEKSLIILVNDLDMLKDYVEVVPEVAMELIASMSDPLTIIYPKAKKLPKNVTATDGSIGIRIPRHDFCQQMISAFGKPVSSTSANISGAPIPFSLRGVSDEIKSAVDYVADVEHQTSTRPTPSTIIKIDSQGEIHILRN